MERYFKAIEKIKELEAEVQRRAQTEGELRKQLAEKPVSHENAAEPFITNDEKYIDFVKKIANTKSKFAKEARDLLGD